MTPEGRVKAAVKRKLKAAGIWHFMPVSNGMGQHGIPDIIACARGRFVGIECKAPGKRSHTTVLQEIALADINIAGGVAIVVDDANQLDPILKELTCPNQHPLSSNISAASTPNPSKSPSA